jgi:hypothetical protein
LEGLKTLEDSKESGFNVENASFGHKNAFKSMRNSRLITNACTGKGYRLDEVFFFETADEAQQFYQSDLSDFECFIGDEHEPCGFEEVSLYIDGRRVATKSCTPSTPPKVSHDRAEMKGNSAGVTIVQDEISEK